MILDTFAGYLIGSGMMYLIMRHKIKSSIVLELKRKSQLELNAIYRLSERREEDHPWRKPINVKLVDIKEGWVRYRILNDDGSMIMNELGLMVNREDQFLRRYCKLDSPV